VQEYNIRHCRAVGRNTGIQASKASMHLQELLRELLKRKKELEMHVKGKPYEFMNTFETYIFQQDSYESQAIPITHTYIYIYIHIYE
jgi:hypothetical protein